ncbi:ribosome small subunit-dependent GTPase A [Litorilinea aerophila]|uniref:ribosome small subunit-dependent GTPase A n=1 Tax=Litorilinea aerophila TaxID=1204385 RepID=UPI001B884A9B|nr:ribosome small subunit-dependent GTPase A [Litorilinea aerophila]MCC9078711.1 ribosome small subunit-dependent GTPase A [Litorilinea aerophila]GIV78294.1 MAG: putative ribosome biogenesis GTPase RsgA [Litorilinea sp.]
MARRKYEPTYEYEEFEAEFESLAEEPRRGRKPKPKKASANLLPGIVIRARGHHYDVLLDAPDEAAQSGTQDGRAGDTVLLCEVRGRLLLEKGRDTLVAVGDRVWVMPHGKGRGWIERIEERHSVLSRQQPGTTVPAEDVILANPDQALVVFAVAQPEPHLRMLDRFLVIAEANELPAIICANKIDLTGEAQARSLFQPYEEIGYRVIYASAVTRAGIDELRDLLLDRITVVTGPSGVGKSSLLNAIHPDLNLRTGDLRDFLDKGRHTTRAAQLFHLPFGRRTFVADTPGIRELGLYEIDPADLGFYFVDIKPFVNDCRYPNCTHDHEPGCAVRAAVEAGKIRRERYESYLRLLHGDE